MPRRRKMTSTRVKSRVSKPKKSPRKVAKSLTLAGAGTRRSRTHRGVGSKTAGASLRGMARRFGRVAGRKIARARFRAAA